MKVTAFALAALMLAGCATTAYPPLYTAPARGLAGPEMTAAILEDARLAQVDFANRFQTAARRNDRMSLPLVAAAAATAGILFFGQDKDALFALGLGAGTYAAARAVIDPPGMAPLYLQAHSALGCVRRNGSSFSGASAASTELSVRGQLVALQGALTTSELASVSAPPPKLAPAQLSARAATQLRLRDLIAAARVIETSAQRELAAFARAPETLGAAVEAIHLGVVSRGRQGRTVDVAALSQSLLGAGKASIPAATPAPPLMGVNVGGAPFVDPSPEVAFQQLAAAKTTLENEMPEYSAALARVAKCPAEVTGS